MKVNLFAIYDYNRNDSKPKKEHITDPEHIPCDIQDSQKDYIDEVLQYKQ